MTVIAGLMTMMSGGGEGGRGGLRGGALIETPNSLLRQIKMRADKR